MEFLAQEFLHMVVHLRHDFNDSRLSAVPRTGEVLQVGWCMSSGLADLGSDRLVDIRTVSYNLH